MDEYLKLIVRLQALSQNGLAYVNNEFDKERYEEIRDIACQLMEYKTDLPFEKIKDLFGSEQGYQTPKIDTRAAIFKDNKILLVHENNDTWALPGGWCDTLESIKSNTIKEVNEKTGLDVDAIRTVSKGIEMYKNEENAVLIITHNTRILENLKVDYVHILVDGKIVKTGDASLAQEIEVNGYSQYK